MINFIFCFYDLGYSPQFLKSWVNLCNFLNKKKVKYLITQGDSCNAFYAKQMCLGGNVLAGPKQKPYQNKINYDVLVFLSNKITFTSTTFIKTLDKFMESDHKFLSGMFEGRYKAKNEDDNYIIADFLDFDLVFIKKGIFEQLTYPWFKPHVSKNKIEQQYIDIDICNRIKEQNIDLLIDKNIELNESNFNFVKIK